ncbi:TSUP family transporter [Lysinibacillus alkalisoli]|uniref:TSUP family transporter n=1 Tax=Lysinibacillus alkalisoli TaxID=1911548 RepID=UPI00166558E5|nr:TSUP family transporter [Lysinibacillus alkalisoli]
MGELDPTIIIILLSFGFLAAFIDAVVGGGGLISLPALLFTGLPPATAIATNKLAGTIGSLTSTIIFYRSGNVSLQSLKNLFPSVFIGAMLGAYTVHLIDPALLKPLMLIMLAAVAIYTIIKKDWGAVSRYQKLTPVKQALFIGLIFGIGFYDGFLGPGTGSFLLFAFLLIGFNFLQAAGNAKLLNFGSNIAALLMFMYLGEVVYSYGLIMGAAQLVGSIVGSKFAIKKGSSYVRLLFIVVTIVLLAKNTWDYFM